MRENLAVFFKEIGPAGIFTVETKTHSKPIGDARIVFDGEAIRIGGFELDRDPVIQAKAQASWLRELLTESTGRKCDVKSAIVFSRLVRGLYRSEGKNNLGAQPQGVTVISRPRACETITRGYYNKLTAFHLSRFVRTNENNTVGGGNAWFNPPAARQARSVLFSSARDFQRAHRRWKFPVDYSSIVPSDAGRRFPRWSVTSTFREFSKRSSSRSGFRQRAVGALSAK